MSMNKKDFQKEFYPFLLEHYKFLYDRRTDIKRSFDFLLTFESLLLLVYVQLFWSFILQAEFIYWIPLLAFISSISLTFYNILPIRIWFHWIERHNWRNYQLENVNTYDKLWEDLFGVVPHLYWYNEKKKKSFKKNILLIFISGSLFISVLLIHIHTTFLLFLFVPICFLTWILIERTWEKEAVPLNPAKENEKFFDEWDRISKLKKFNYTTLKNTYFHDKS